MVAYGEDSLVIWDVRTGRLRRSLTGFGTAVRCGRFLADGTKLVTGSDAAYIRIWDLNTGKQINSGHVGLLDIFKIVVSPDETRIVCCSSDGAVNIVNARNLQYRRCSHEHHDLIYGADFSSDGQLFATASIDFKVVLCDTRTGKVRRVLTDTGCNGCNFVDRSKYLITLEGEKLKVWRVADLLR
jgi:WD40 repeat protein